MENYAVLFPSLPSSSSSHQFSPHLQPFSSTMISTQPTFGSHHLHGNPTDVFWGMKEENSRFVSSSDGYPRVLQIGNYGGGGGSSDGAATGRPTGKIKKGEKKIKKPKYAFQTRSQVDILDDGYRWRKYGQKAVKNNRNYYKCTHQGCNVKKQVQRHTKDEGIVVTTYEGMHTHPIEKTNDNFEHILSQMQIYSNF